MKNCFGGEVMKLRAPRAGNLWWQVGKGVPLLPAAVVAVVSQAGAYEVANFHLGASVSSVHTRRHSAYT